MKKLVFSGKILLAALIISCIAIPFAAASQVTFPVELRGGQAEISATIFENPKSFCFGATILAVHGLTETAETWRPLTEQMFATQPWGKTVKRVIAIDLPGHGNSPIPTGLPGGTFGQLLIDDNMSVIYQSIVALQAMDMAPRVIMGHSMGGLAIQGLQEALIAQEASFAYLGIFRTILIAPVPVASSVWTQGPASDVTSYILGEEDGPLGQYVYFPAIVQQLYGGSYNTLTGGVVPNVPSLELVETYNAPEPLWTLSQLTGASPLLPARPDAREGAFSIMRGTLLNVISFSQDVLVPAGDLDDLYAYLTGTSLGMFYRNIEQDDACHSMHISNPAAVVNVLKKLPPF